MALTLTTVGPSIDRRPYKELPAGVSRWVSRSTGTGATSGVVSAILDFNSGAAPEFTKFVSIDFVNVFTETAALTSLGVNLKKEANHWEDGPLAAYLGTFQLIELNSSIKFGGSMASPKYLGRFLKNVSARLTILTQEVLNTLYTIDAGGFIGDKPFLAPDFWRS